jgi:hypothetical protein
MWYSYGAVPCVLCDTLYVLFAWFVGKDAACSVATLPGVNSIFLSCGICSLIDFSCAWYFCMYKRFQCNILFRL